MADPAFLPIGTEVSAKYRGAFCEAKVKKMVKVVRMKVAVKDYQPSTCVGITDEHVVSGVMKVGNEVGFKHPETGQVMEGLVVKLNDQSTYTVVFNDGDERTLRRNQLCLKGNKHYDVSETLDNLPLSHPEHFGTPVLKSKKTVQGKNVDSESEKDDSSSEDESPRRPTYKTRHQELVGKVMVVEVADKRKGALTPVLVVLPDAHPVELKNRDHLLVRSFRDTKFMAVNRKDLKEFSRETAIKNEDKALKAAFEKALLYFDGSELPVNWNREELLGPDQDDGEEEDESSDDNEQCEEKDRFVAQLYKFMDDRGTPINKGPCIGNKDLNLYRLFKVVQNIGGYNKVTNQMKWRLVYSKMGLPPSNSAAHQIRNAYKKYLHAFEDFYRKLGSIMGTISRPGRQSRQTPSRGILPFRGRDRDSSPRSPRTDKVTKEDKSKEDEKVKAKAEEASHNEKEDTAESVPEESDSDVVRRSTPRREKGQKEEAKGDKKEDQKAKKEDEKKEDTVKEEKKKEEKREERKSLRQSLKEKEEEKKEAMKAKEEDKREGKTDRVLRKDLTDKEEEDKRESEDPKEIQKKRVSRRKAVRIEEEKKESEEKEEEEEDKGDDKKDKKEKKPPASTKKEKVSKKKPDGEETDAKNKESDDDSDEDCPSDSQDQEDLPLGTKLKVRYGRGRNQKIYEAKVIEHGGEGARKNYLVHYAGWNTRYDEWVKTDRIVEVVDKPETSKLKKKTLAARITKVPIVPPVTKSETPLLKKRGRQSSQPVLSTSNTSKLASTPPPNEPKTQKGKSSASASSSKTRSTRSNSTEHKPETLMTSTPKHRITRRSSGINETADEPVIGSAEGGSESDGESEPTLPSAAGIASDSDHEEEVVSKDAGVEVCSEAKEATVRPSAYGEEYEPTPSQEEDSVLLKIEDSEVKPFEAESEIDLKAMPPAITDYSHDAEPQSSVPFQGGVSMKDSDEKVSDVCKIQLDEPVMAPTAEELKEPQKMEEPAPQLVRIKDDVSLKEERCDRMEKGASTLFMSGVTKNVEAQKAAPVHDPSIPLLKKIDLDLSPSTEKKEGKEKEKMKQSKRLGRDSKKNRQNDARSSVLEIPTLEPMTTPNEVKPPPVAVTPSPYDFNDTEADSPSPWQPEITKKWEPSIKPLSAYRDVKLELKKSLENERKKVKKKTKKISEQTSSEGDKLSSSDSPSKLVEKKVKDISIVKKGRKRKEEETKVDTSSYEETVNSVVESCKADEYIEIPLPQSLMQKEERPAKKRKTKASESLSNKEEEVEDNSKKEEKTIKGLKGKIGRKRKVSECGAEPSTRLARAGPPSVSSPQGSSSVTCQEKQQHSQLDESPSAKQPRLEADFPSASSHSCAASLNNVTLPKAGPSGMQILSMAAIRPVPNASETGGAECDDRLAPQLKDTHGDVKQTGSAAQIDCAGEMRKAPCSVGNTVLDNTPPTTPENDLDEANSASSSSEGHDNLKEDLDSLDSGERTCKGGSESPPGCDFSLSSASSENLPSSGSGAQTCSQPSQHLESGSTAKRKRKDETGGPVVKKKKRLASRSTRGERNKKSPKYGDDDSQSNSPLHQNGADSNLVTAGSDSTKGSTPRPQKFHFADDLGEHLKGEARIQFLLEKMKEVRKVFQGIKAEVAAIDRKRKRARRREKERESSHVTSVEREAS